MTAGTQAVASKSALMTSTTEPHQGRGNSESEASLCPGHTAGWVSCLLPLFHANTHSGKGLLVVFGFGLGFLFLFFAIVPTYMSKLFWEIIFCF